MRQTCSPLAAVAAVAGLALALAAPAGASLQQAPANATTGAPASATAPAARVLQPFLATYEAWYDGKPAGTATMQVVRDDAAARWRVDLGIRGNRGFAGVVGLNLEQSTVFDEANGIFRPLSQSTVRKAAALFNRKVTGTYDWHANTAQWTGDIKKTRREPVPIRYGDMSGLLINLAVIRDAEPGKALHYRFVDGGRVRDYDYQVAAQTEPVTVAELSYEAMRVERTNGGNDETIFWIADGVPTPVRILQREDGEDAVDLRLVEYRGAQ
ncbi:MAG TPA: DUF3108 domain-containing protein [Luteimonas sp.]|nr:DUF3108 domain-containing protein [Luteimonas sp.]HRO26054.1 DUF3108 domain-containing protein [Luteimonas sp.]HRP71632.1 DUF3108 domain-containing protein [Luteimonas sp.]